MRSHKGLGLHLNYPSIMVVVPRGSMNYTWRVSRTLKNVDTYCDYEGKVEEEKALGVKIDLERTKLRHFTLTFRVDTKVWKDTLSFVTSLA